MIITISVRIDTDPSDNNQGMFGGLNFSENSQFSGAGFTTVSRVFTRCHELLATLKQEHDSITPGEKRK